MTPAETYHRTAQGHLLGAEILSSHQRNPDGSRSPIFFCYYNNLGLSIELYLKCYLNIMGYTEQQLQQRPFQHDIPYLYSTCHYLFGLDVCSVGMHKIVDLIGYSYADHGYRYQKGAIDIGFINEGPATFETFMVLKMLDKYLWSELLALK